MVGGHPVAIESWRHFTLAARRRDHVLGRIIKPLDQRFADLHIRFRPETRPPVAMCCVELIERLGIQGCGAPLGRPQMLRGIKVAQYRRYEIDLAARVERELEAAGDGSWFSTD